MRTENKIPLSLRILHGIISLALLLSAFGAGRASPVQAQGVSAFALKTYHALSDGQFVSGPNIGDFNIKNYLRVNAPHLLNYADDLYARSEDFSINPKVYLTLLEVHSKLITVLNTGLMEDPLGLHNGDLIAQIEALSSKMSEAYYLHLYTYSPLPVLQRGSLASFATPGGVTINTARDTNAGTYAIIAGLAAMDEQDISLLLDTNQPNGFYRTYVRLFGDDPLNESNHVQIAGEAGALAAPSGLLQLPYLQGLTWRFGGVHNTSGGTTFTDASALDFYPGNLTWGMDTSGMWVVAAASGIPTRYSDCGFKVSHSGALNVGWETTYYHLEGARYLSGSINQNDKIGVIANTLAEATCTGGASSGPHVHFSLKYNGVFFAINGTPLSGWYVHSGRYSYDVDPNYMWLERAGIKKYPYSDVVLSEGLSKNLSASTVGNGTVTSNPPGINCGVDCSESYGYSTLVTLTATPAAGSMFLGWSGACSGMGTCTVTMMEARSVAAAFALKSFADASKWTTDFSYDQGWRADLHPRLTGDVNGDGVGDLIGFGYGGVFVTLSNGVDKFLPVSRWTTDFSYNQGWRADMHPRVAGDMNGDGADDLIGFGYGGVFVALSNGVDSFLPVSRWTTDFSYDQGWRADLHPRMIGDVNGDGADDLVGFGYGGVFVTLSNGVDKFLPVSRWSTDFSYNQGWRADLHPRVTGDVNGDGVDDLVGFGYGGVFVALSNGVDSFLPVSRWATDFSYDQGWRAELHPRVTGDVNGDGRNDLIGFGSGGVFAALSDGSKFLPVSIWTTDYSYIQGWRTEFHPRTVGDMNGDGKDDLVGFGYGGVFVAPKTLP